MPLRSPTAQIVALCLALFAVPARAADFVDSAERYVVIPDRVGRVMAANQSAAVLVFVLAPEKLAGWSRPLTARSEDGSSTPSMNPIRRSMP